jgi:hypothetical protein
MRPTRPWPAPSPARIACFHCPGLEYTINPPHAVFCAQCGRNLKTGEPALKTPPAVVSSVLENEPSSNEVDPEDLAYITRAKLCPDCKDWVISDGPRGGAGRNMLCMKCMTEFCVAFAGQAAVWGMRMGQPTPERVRTIYGMYVPQRRWDEKTERWV